MSVSWTFYAAEYHLDNFLGKIKNNKSKDAVFVKNNPN